MVSRIATTWILAAALIAGASAAHALSSEATLSDWRNASKGDRIALTQGMIERVDRPGVTVTDLYACIEEVASDPALGSQTIRSVAAGCILLLES